MGPEKNTLYSHKLNGTEMMYPTDTKFQLNT